MRRELVAAVIGALCGAQALAGCGTESEHSTVTETSETLSQGRAPRRPHSDHHDRPGHAPRNEPADCGPVDADPEVDAGATVDAQTPADAQTAVDAGTTVDAQTPTDGGTPSTPRHLVVAVYLPRTIETCFIGDTCDPSTDACLGLRDDSNALVEAFTTASLIAVRTSSPQRQGAQKEVCVSLQMSDQDQLDVERELSRFRAFVLSSSHGSIELELRTIAFEHLDMNESRWGDGFFITPADLQEFALPRLDFLPDFNLVVPPIRDPAKRLHHDLGGCGGTYGADFGLRGGGWSWVPKTSSSFWFECGEESVFTHEWLHQVHFAYDEISQFQDLYGSNLPLCGAGDPDPSKWFPDSHQCNVDPDFESCGRSDCGGNDLVNAHILSTHWDPTFPFVANHCRDGRQDFSETGVDSGGQCAESAASVATMGPSTSASRLPTLATLPLPTR